MIDSNMGVPWCSIVDLIADHLISSCLDKVSHAYPAQDFSGQNINYHMGQPNLPGYHQNMHTAVHNPHGMVQYYPEHSSSGMMGNQYQYIQRNMHAAPYERESYSPDVARASTIETHDFRRYSGNDQFYPGQVDYPSHRMTQVAHDPHRLLANNQEIKLNFKSESLATTSAGLASNSVGEGSEQAQPQDFEDAKVHDKPLQKTAETNIYEKAYQLAKDQSGCRMLQKKIDDQEPGAKEAIYSNILPHFVELMNNPFGNYLCQKSTEHCDKDQLRAIIETIKEDVVDICCNSHGTRAIQRIVECSKDQELIDMLIGILKDHVQTLVEDINGNHAIQKVLFTFKPPNNEFIFEKMIAQCQEIACHKHGCCVMQKWIDGADEDQKERLIDEIISHTQAFVRNPYGNYVVQYVLDLKDLDINSKIGNQLLGSLIELGLEKYSSNVIEKCLELTHKEVKNKMVKEMLTADSYLSFLKDQYGNYVIQKTLGVAEKDDLEILLAKIKPDMESLRKASDLGQKIYNKLAKTYPSLQWEGYQPKTRSKKKGK